MEVTVGAYLASRIENLGIQDYFAIPGDFNLILLDEFLKNPNLRMINCCNELNAGYAADGYARARGISALVVTYSVGSLSCVNAVAGAYAEDLPIIVISGGPNTLSSMHHPNLHHTLGNCDYTYVRDIYEKITVHTEIIRDPTNAPHQIDHAIAIALKKSKPVYLEIACNISNAKVSAPHPLNFFHRPHSDPKTLHAAVEHAARFLNSAVKPLLVVGGKTRACRGTELAESLADHSQYAVACMADAKGYFSEAHPNFIGIYWGFVSTPGCGETVESSDAYMFVGPRFTDYSTVGYTSLIKASKLVLVAPDFVQVEGQTYAQVYLSDFLEALTPKLKPNPTSLEIYNRVKTTTEPPISQGPKAPLSTARLFARIQKMLTKDSAVIAETGDSWFNGNRLHLPKGCGYEVQMQYGSIGWSVGALLGYATACPKKQVIGLIGDGSFQMTAQEVSTFIRYNIPAILFLLNNSAYTIEVQIHDGPYNVIQNWHYSKLIDVFSRGKTKGQGFVVTNEKELNEAIEKAAGFEGISFIEVILDRDDCNKSLLEWGTRVANYNSQPPLPTHEIPQWD